MTIEFKMPKRLPEDLPSIEEEPEAMIGAAEEIQEIGKKHLQLCIDRNECLCNLRFSFDSENQRQLYASNMEPNFWRSHKKIAKKYWGHLQVLEAQRTTLLQKIENLEKLCENKKINKTNLIFHNFWAGQNGQIYASLEKYTLSHKPCCVIL